MLTVACVQVGNYAGRGAEYVTRLFAGIERYLSVPWRGACLTDDPASVPGGIEAIVLPEVLNGWWNKLQLFRPGIFAAGRRVLYFDLDTVIVGSLDDLAGYQGRFGCMEFGGKPASGIMAWEAGKSGLWTAWEAHWRPVLTEGDQQWVGFAEPEYESLTGLFPGQLVSFKADVLRAGEIPQGARAVYFHGRPRPHECAEPWRSKLWNNGA